MNTTLRDEIKQSRPFASPEEEVFLNLLRTSARLQHAYAEEIKPLGITLTQYNVLRILRGAGEGGLCRHEIRDRMLTPVPDVTRLLDRLADAGLVTRERSSVDRRLVTARISAEGLRLLGEMDEPTAERHERYLGHMSDRDLRRLADLLGEARRGIPTRALPEAVPSPG